jgi:hypothetical protein
LFSKPFNRIITWLMLLSIAFFLTMAFFN